MTKDETKRRLLAHFGIDIPIVKDRDVVMKYVPVVFAFTNTESTWMYQNLFEFACCVFHLAGIKVKNRDQNTQWLQNKLCEHDVELTYDEKQVVRSLVNVETTSELEINVLVSDFAIPIKNANDMTLRAAHMGDVVHVKRNFFERLRNTISDELYQEIHGTLTKMFSMLRHSRTDEQFSEVYQKYN